MFFLQIGIEIVIGDNGDLVVPVAGVKDTL